MTDGDYTQRPRDDQWWRLLTPARVMVANMAALIIVIVAGSLLISPRERPGWWWIGGAVLALDVVFFAFYLARRRPFGGYVGFDNRQETKLDGCIAHGGAHRLVHWLFPPWERPAHFLGHPIFTFALSQSLWGFIEIQILPHVLSQSTMPWIEWASFAAAMVIACLLWLARNPYSEAINRHADPPPAAHDRRD